MDAHQGAAAGERGQPDRRGDGAAHHPPGVPQRGARLRGGRRRDDRGAPSSGSSWITRVFITITSVVWIACHRQGGAAARAADMGPTGAQLAGFLVYPGLGEPE